MAQARLKTGRISGLPQVPMPEADPLVMADQQAAFKRRADLDAESARRREADRYFSETGQLPMPPGLQRGTWGAEPTKQKATGDLAAFSRKRKPKKDEGRVPSEWQRKRGKIGQMLRDTTQGASDTARYYAGPHAGQSMENAGQWGKIAGYALPLVGDLIDVSEQAGYAVEDALGGDWLGAAGAAGLGGVSLLPGIFIGPKARFYPYDKADEAMQLLIEGVDPKEIERLTGAVFDGTGTPRFEISDKPMKLTPYGETMASQPSRYTPDFEPEKLPQLERQVYHPELFANYPEIGQSHALLQYDGGEGRGAFYSPYGMNPTALDAYGPRTGQRNMLDIITHEVQHNVDYLEGAPPGANPRKLPIDTGLLEFRKKHAKAPDKTVGAYDTYRMESGENLANAAKYRREYSPADRKIVSVYNSMDYPPSKQWVNIPRKVGPAFDPFNPPSVDPVGSIVPDPSGRLDVPPPSRGNRPSSASVEMPATPVAPEVPARRRPISGLGDFPSTDPNHIANMTATQGGYSVNIPTGQNPTDGFMMGMYANTDPRNMVIDGQMTAEDASRFYGTNRKVLQGDDKYFGTWHNADDGKTYLDVSRRFPPDGKRAAVKYGERTGQLAGFDVAAMDTFPVGNWEEFIQSDEFAQRLATMADEGGQFLDQYPTRQWWNMMGTSIEDTYGPNTPYMAGYTAATAPNAQPRENLQTASEYMRRQIKGEPAVQPDWRVGDAGGPSMSRAPGTKIGMEQSRVGNLERASRGEPLGGPKVESERRAMLGDPDAIVLDRWHARLAEDPARGILTEAQEGTISSENYPALEQRFRDVARQRGMTPRDFSADVWTGAREKVRNSGELFGTPYKASAVRGESKAYADVWTDLVNEKARFLGISPQEMMQRLRAGDANLLSVLPAIPGGMMILQAMGYGSEPVAADEGWQ